MKKHGQRMIGLGIFFLFLLAIASDSGNLAPLSLFALSALSGSLILLGNLFSQPRKKRRVAQRRPVSAMPVRGEVMAFRTAA